MSIITTRRGESVRGGVVQEEKQQQQQQTTICKQLVHF